LYIPTLVKLLAPLIFMLRSRGFLLSTRLLIILQWSKAPLGWN